MKMNPGKRFFLQYLRTTPFKETDDHGTYFFHPYETSKNEWVACISGNTALVVRSIAVVGSCPRFETRNGEYCNELPKFKERMDRLAADYVIMRGEYAQRMNKYKEAQIRKAAEKFCE